MKKRRFLGVTLAAAIAISSLTATVGGLVSAQPTSLASTMADDGTIVGFGSDGWSYKKVVTQEDFKETQVPGTGLQVDDTWTDDVKLPIGYAGSGKPMESLLNSGTNIGGGRCMGVVLQKDVTIDDASKIKGAQLSVSYDDGMVVYVNGTLAGAYHAELNSNVETGDMNKFPILGYRMSGSPVGNDPESQSGITLDKNLFKDGKNVITVALVNDRDTSSDIFGDIELIATLDGVEGPETPSGTSIAKGDEWLWVKNGSDGMLAEDYEPTTSWAKAASPIGYGYKGVSGVADADNVPFENNCSNVYLRRILHIDDMSKVNSVVLNAEMDDWATVYFNGHKAAPTFNDGGTINKDPYKTGDVRVAPTGLHEGDNVIAVKVSNTNATSSDLYFNMSLTTSEESMGFQGEKFVMTPGKDETERGFAWYTPYEGEPGAVMFSCRTDAETPYIYENNAQHDGGVFWFCDRTSTITYKLPLDKTQTKATLRVEVAANYTIELSNNSGSGWSEKIADPSLAGVGECGKENQHKEVIDVTKYLSGDYLYLRIGDQTTDSGWGGCVYSVELIYGEYPPANLKGAAVQIAETSTMTGANKDTFPATAKVVAGTVQEANTGFASNQVTVTGLKADTQYSYRYGNTEDNLWSPVYTFTTHSTEDGYKAIFVGDPQIGGSGNAASDGEGWNITMNRAMELVPDAAMILSAGDNSDGKKETEYEALTSAEQFKKVPFAPVRGNHDDTNPSHGYHFNMPNLTKYGMTGGVGDYYFSYGNTLVMALNANNKNVAEHKLAMQEAIASHPDAKWKIVLMHFDVYGGGKHAVEEPESNHLGTIGLRKNLVPIFEELGIDLALTGHDHSYVRSYLMKDQQTQKDQLTDEKGAVIDANGILYITGSCSSGAKFYDLVGNPDWAAFKDQTKTPQFSVLEVTDNQFTIKTYISPKDTSKDLTLLDEVSLKKAATEEDMNTAISKAKEYKAEDYTADSFENLQTAIKGAEDTLKLAAPTADQMNKAYADLDAAVDALVKNDTPPAEVDKTALNKAIDDAQAVYDAAKAGDNKGEYPQAAKDALKAAIATAKGVADDKEASADAVAKAVNDLNAAVETFKKAVITKDPDTSSSSKPTQEPDSSTNTPDPTPGDDSSEPVNGADSSSSTTGAGNGNGAGTGNGNVQTGENMVAVFVGVALLGLSAGAAAFTANRRRKSE